MGAGLTLELQPIVFRDACAFVVAHHRHHLPPQGCKFCIAVNDGDKIVGVVIVGRPVSRHLDNGWTAEVTRCCTDGTKHAASMLYSAAWRAARAMGYKRLITYTLKSEAGVSIVAAGWRVVGQAGGGEWNCKARPRLTGIYPTEQKTLWEVTIE